MEKAKQFREDREMGDRALGRRDRRKLAIRQSLLSAARSLLVSRSMDAFSIDEIVQRADVARGTFYNYFSDKDALERELATQIRLRLEQEIAKVNQQVTDAPERIARAFLSILRLSIAEPHQAALMMRLFPHATDPATPINSGVRADAAKGIAQGRILKAPQDVAVAYIIGVFLAGMNRVLDLPKSRIRKFAEGLGAILLHGLGLDRGEADRIMRQAGESILASTIEARVNLPWSLGKKKKLTKRSRSV